MKATKWLMKYLKRLEKFMDDVLNDIYDDVDLELFVMVKVDKDKFVFGQINMKAEIFSYFYNDPIDSVDISNVEFSKIIEIDNKDDLVKFFIQFETDLSDFITLNEYQDLSSSKFTKAAKSEFRKATGGGENIWVNEAWSDLITGC